MQISRVLLVDDDPDVREVASISLRGVGRMEVVVAESGEQAVALAARQRPDVVLLDTHLPGFDAESTLAELRATPGAAEIPVIFMTAVTRSEEWSRLVGLGATGVISKPFNPLTLPGAIRALL